MVGEYSDESWHTWGVPVLTIPQFLCIIAFAALVSFLCLGIYTPVNPAVVLAAPIITLIFIIPIGIVSSISGMQPSLNVISEMFGGLIAGGDTMFVQYFRMFGSEPVYHALIYANDLKVRWPNCPALHR